MGLYGGLYRGLLWWLLNVMKGDLRSLDCSSHGTDVLESMSSLYCWRGALPDSSQARLEPAAASAEHGAH